jgi:hypothetical protein
MQRPLALPFFKLPLSLLDLAYSKSFEKAAKKSLNTAQLSAPERRKRTLFKDSLSLLHVPIDSEAITPTTPGEQLKDKERMLDFGMF